MLLPRPQSSRQVFADSAWVFWRRIDSCCFVMAVAHSERSFSRPVLQAEEISNDMSATAEAVAMVRLIAPQACLAAFALRLSMLSVGHLLI